VAALLSGEQYGNVAALASGQQYMWLFSHLANVQMAALHHLANSTCGGSTIWLIVHVVAALHHLANSTRGRSVICQQCLWWLYIIWPTIHEAALHRLTNSTFGCSSSGHQWMWLLYIIWPTETCGHSP
jgi:hypothetical protein